MFKWLIHLIVDAGVLFIAAKAMRTVYIRSFSTALLVAIMIGILSFLIGWLITLLLNVATLGIFYFTGLGFITRTIANAIIIEIADQMSSGFNTKGFWPSLWLAIIIALVGSIVDAILFY
ncbi:MAG: phage holin family protein [Candidatus Cyclobacteriaceae bacterium M3_2C_046]